MKNILSALLIIALILLYSCSSGPEKTAKNFTENLAKGKVEEAKKYATESTGSMLDFAVKMGGMSVNPDFKFEMIRDSIVGNKAWVFAKDEKGKEEVIELVKIDGDWKVNIQSKK